MGAQCNFPGGSDGKESACNVGDPGSIPGLGRYPGEGNGYPLQYCCLENSMDRGAWRLQSLGHKELDTTERLTHHTHTHRECNFKGLWRGKQEDQSQRGMWRCYRAGSEDPGKDREPRDVGNLQKLERQADGSSPGASTKIKCYQTPLHRKDSRPRWIDTLSMVKGIPFQTLTSRTLRWICVISTP